MIRRRQRAPRQPNTSTPAERPVTPIQIHSVRGAGSSAMPSVSTYQCAQVAAPTPISRASGNHSTRHRRERHPVAKITTPAVTAWIVIGSHPCSNETPWRYPTGGSANRVAATLHVDGVTPNIVDCDPGGLL
jgi:hypothetical protein